MTMSGRQPQHRTNGNLFGPQPAAAAPTQQHAQVHRLRDVMARVHDQLEHLPREERRRVLRALLTLEGEP
jgi:hypothetical protein